MVLDRQYRATVTPALSHPDPSQMTPAQLIIAEADARSEKYFAEFAPGLNLRWRRFGDGPPLVLLHGGHGSWLHWLRNIPALSAAFSLWLPDMPGYGDSDGPNEELDIRQVAQAVASSLAGLIGADTPIRLGGFSFGGLIATQLALLRPNIERLALVGVSGHGGPRRQLLPMSNWRGLAPEAETAALRQNLASLMLSPRNIDDELALAIHRACCHRTRFRSRNLSMSGPLPALLNQLGIPVFVIFGAEDVTAVPSRIGLKLVDGHAERRLEIIEEAGHWVQFENHQAADALLAQWFASRPTG